MVSPAWSRIVLKVPGFRGGKDRPEGSTPGASLRQRPERNVGPFRDLACVPPLPPDPEEAIPP